MSEYGDIPTLSHAGHTVPMIVSICFAPTNSAVNIASGDFERTAHYPFTDLANSTVVGYVIGRGEDRHGPGGWPDSDWLRIRRREEPVPQFENVAPRNAQ